MVILVQSWTPFWLNPALRGGQMSELAPEVHQTRQMGGLQLSTAQKKTSARAVQCSFTLGCCSKGPYSSLWSLGASAGSCYLPKHTKAATCMPCKQLYQLCYTTKQPATSTFFWGKSCFVHLLLLCLPTKQHQPPSSLVRAVGVNCCVQLCCLSSLSLICSADRGLQKLFARTTWPAAQGSGWLENVEMQVDQTFAFSLCYSAWKS